MSSRHGTIIATCASPSRGVPKYVQVEVEVGPDGIVGDAHAGDVRSSRRGGQPNDRQISIVAKEVFDDLAETLQIELHPGDFAENFLVEGLGDLSDLEPGDRIRLGDEVVVAVAEQNPPCAKLLPLHPDILRHVIGRRGVVCAVIAVGAVRPGESVEILRSEDSLNG